VIKVVLKIAIVLVLIAGSQVLHADTQSEIKSALEYYAEMWNEGDIDALSSYYHQDFILLTDNGVVPSGQRVDDLKSLTQAGEDRGELSYSDLTVKSLEQEHAIAYGRLSLKFKDGSSIKAWFSTIYRKTPFGWKAILTHN
jgi:ketosteroid isomerase-like protein